MLLRHNFFNLLTDDKKADGGGGEQGGSQQAASKGDDPQKYIEALQKRLNERDEALKTMRERLEAVENAQKQRLEQSGNYEELLKQARTELETYRPLKERAETLEAAIRADNEAQIALIPEGKRGLVPVDYSPEKLKAWLTANMKSLTVAPAPNFDAGMGAAQAGGASSVGGTLTEDEKALAKRFGMTEAQYLAALKRARGET